MDKVYIVCGFSGQYEDYRTWNVEAHYTEEAANKRCEFLNNLLLNLMENRACYCITPNCTAFCTINHYIYKDLRIFCRKIPDC